MQFYNLKISLAKTHSPEVEISQLMVKVAFYNYFSMSFKTSA